MDDTNKRKKLGRRDFFRMLTLGGIGAAMVPGVVKRSVAAAMPQTQPKAVKPATNISDALAYPRTSTSMPGSYPGKVVRVDHSQSYVDGQIVEQAAYDMVERGLLALTGAASIREAWLQFVKPGERIGLKLNPIGGTLLSSSHQVVSAVIRQLEQAGIERKDITIWDRREFQLHEAGFTAEKYPGVRIVGVECRDEQGSYFGADGKLLSEARIDKDWYYWADVEGEYDDYTMPYMVNGGKYSYFSRILTQELDKVINIPVLKNAGAAVTLCLKNMGFGCITNTARLHKELWSETCAQVCAFPPIRDKVVLNIADGIIGCYNGGPGANPQFIVPFNTVLVGTDPVAVDSVGYDIVIAKRIAMKAQERDTGSGRKMMQMAAEMGLGEADPSKIDITNINLA